MASGGRDLSLETQRRDGGAGDAAGAGWQLRAWFLLAAVVGLALPLVVLGARWRQPAVRRALVPSLTALVVQAGFERQDTRRGRSGDVRAIGAAGTVVRLAMLAAAWAGPRRHVRPPAHRDVTAVLAANLVFWTANLEVLRRSGRDEPATSGLPSPAPTAGPIRQARPDSAPPS